MKLKPVMFAAVFAAVVSVPALAQGSFAQIAVGQVQGIAGSYWKTTLIFVNTGQTEVDLTVNFFQDDGTPLNVPVVGGTTGNAQPVKVPGNGSARLELDQTQSSTTLEGWAQVQSAVSVRGQAIYRSHLASGQDYEAVVPMLSPGQPVCLIYIPPGPTTMLMMPFDNTNGYTTAVAFANLTASDDQLQLNFVDENGSVLLSPAISLTAQQHIACPTNQPGTGTGCPDLSALASKRGTIVVTANQTDFTAIGLLFNPTGPFTTLLPITQ